MHINVMNVYLLMSSTAKSYSSPNCLKHGLSSMVQNLKKKNKNKKKTNESGVTKSSGEATHNFIMMVGCEEFNSIITIHSKMCHHYL